jgi:hypothetical protein
LLFKQSFTKISAKHIKTKRTTKNKIKQFYNVEIENINKEIKTCTFAVSILQDVGPLEIITPQFTLFEL